ncbi:MAG TPA: hypothetical protein VMF03_17735 [Steroidobacteraceae bacterium]|nr:hypothetical protein [Steroidobacteraceae bacterium]
MITYPKRTFSRRPAVLSIVIGCVLLSGGGALAQEANYPAGGPQLPAWSQLPDWDGLWERGGDVGVWDDSLPPGAPQDPPYNGEYLRRYQFMHAAFLRARAQQGGGAPAAAAGGGFGVAGGARGGPGAGAQAGGGRFGPGAAPAGGGAPRFGIGMPGFMVPLWPLNIEVNPHEVDIFSAQFGMREIYTDGRLHPKDPLPSAMGHSIGHWDHGVLLVDTCCLLPDGLLPGAGPHSDAMHIRERIWAPVKGTLKDAITVEDPKAFIHPWKTMKTYYWRPTWEPVTDTAQTTRDFPKPGQSTAVSDAEVQQLLAAAAKDPDNRPAHHALGRRLNAQDTQALQQASAQGIGNTAWETVVIRDVQITDHGIHWTAHLRSADWHCQAQPDGYDPNCVK